MAKILCQQFYPQAKWRGAGEEGFARNHQIIKSRGGWLNNWISNRVFFAGAITIVQRISLY
jgi:hypothetical protein